MLALAACALSLALSLPEARGQVTSQLEGAPVLLHPGYLDVTQNPGANETGANALFESLEGKFAFGEYNEALAPAQAMVELTAVEFGPQAAELAEPLVNLAQVQEMAGLRTEARQSYQASVALIEDRYGAVDKRLVPAYAGLARLDLVEGNYDQAVENFEQARYLLRRNFGLYNLDQEAFLEGQSRAYLLGGRQLEAHRKQMALFELHQREYGADSPEMVPALLRLGDWLGTLYLSLTLSNQNQYACLVERNFNMDPEQPSQCRSPGQRDVYKAAIDILAEHYGSTDYRLIEPLLRLADTYYYQTKRYVQQEFSSGFYDFDRPPASFRPPVRQEGKGLAALQRALKIAEANPVEAADQVVAILIEMGDWHMIYRRNSDTGIELYREAWHRIAQGPGGAAAANETFAQPERLFFLDTAAPPGRGSMSYRTTLYSSTSAPPEGQVTLQLDVTAKGTAENVIVVESGTEDPQGRAAVEARAVADAMFRPRIVDGEAVDARQVQLVRAFGLPF